MLVVSFVGCHFAAPTRPKALAPPKDGWPNGDGAEACPKRPPPAAPNAGAAAPPNGLPNDDAAAAPPNEGAAAPPNEGAACPKPPNEDLAANCVPKPLAAVACPNGGFKAFQLIPLETVLSLALQSRCNIHGAKITGARDIYMHQLTCLKVALRKPLDTAWP